MRAENFKYVAASRAFSILIPRQLEPELLNEDLSFTFSGAFNVRRRACKADNLKWLLSRSLDLSEEKKSTIGKREESGTSSQEGLG